MRIKSIELSRYRIPFRQTFVHAAASRGESDVILITVHADDGRVGFGEIQARPYVTGEDMDSIWSTGAPSLAQRLLGAQVGTPADVENLLGGPAGYEATPALVGGFDIALIDVLDVAGEVDWALVFGPVRTKPVLRCATIGVDVTGDALQRQGRWARLSGCEVIKLKVAGPDDAIRCELLRETVGPSIRLRLDGNAALSADAAEELLRAVSDFSPESIEEPLSKSSSDFIQGLSILHERSGVPNVADESMCVPSDIRRYTGTGAYQSANVRVGKCGGVMGTSRFIEAALSAGLDLVSGTMVGETAVMLRVSAKMLQHCNALEYVEGIDQASRLLVDEVVTLSEVEPGRHFQWVSHVEQRHRVARRNIC